MKRRLLGNAQGTDASVQACTTVSDAGRASWGLFYASVLDFAHTPSSFWAAAAEANTTEEYENQLFEWQKQLSKDCPAIVQSNPNIEPASVLAWGSALKWFGIAAAAIAGAYVVHEVVDVVYLLKPAPKKKEKS
jgi:hypothetical protein